ncbi:MAG TPA: hypothetical protein VE988_07195 [Gemmataceae bacterium]|nr:hypothetical protein [Gemmataceae bacterium]
MASQAYPPRDPRPVTDAEFRYFQRLYAKLFKVARAASPRKRCDPCACAVAWAAVCHLAPEEIFQWMYYHGHVEHLTGPTRAKLVPRDSTLLRPDSWLALTPAGQAFANDMLDLCSQSKQEARARFAMGRLTPRYDEQDRSFRWGVHELKRFRQRAGNQELLCRVFEEERWPDQLDDPLPPKQPGDRKHRLRMTIQKLKLVRKALLHFQGEGSGDSVVWKTA